MSQPGAPVPRVSCFICLVHQAKLLWEEIITREDIGRQYTVWVIKQETDYNNYNRVSCVTE